MSVQVRMEGAGQWARELREMAGRAPDLISAVAAQLGDLVEREAKLACTVDDGGRLRASIGHYTQSDLTGSAKAGPDDAYYELTERDGQVVVAVGTNVPYAAEVEYGTSQAAGQHFLDKALETARQQFSRTCENVWKRQGWK
ncbi:MAG TPA: HK97 gp10 family phage protein [Symbiobacteriaceae bacterium]|jgi:hypothetical protein|nr:HK97 gp10 family phage protein [Symbiobacteriaceae bacterium]